MPRWSSFDAAADRTLVYGLKEGDKASLAALYDDYAERLYDYCLTMSGEYRIAADIVHDTFIDAARRAPRMRDQLRLRSWLYGAARRRCLQRGRTRGLSWEQDPAAIDRVGEEVLGPFTAEWRELLEGALARLDFADQETLLLVVRHGLRPAELSAALSLSSRRAAARTVRAQRRLKAAVDAELLSLAARCADGREPVRALKAADAERELAGHTEALDEGARRSEVVLQASAQNGGASGGPGSGGPGSGGPGSGGSSSGGSGAAAAGASADEDAPAPGKRPPPRRVPPPEVAVRPPTRRPARLTLRMPATVRKDRSRPGSTSRRGRRSEAETEVSLADRLFSPTAAPAQPDDVRLERHLATCRDCRQRRQVPAAALLVMPPAPVLPAALRHRVIHTATDPELAGYRTDIAARGGNLTPGGMPSQPDIPSPYTRRWLFAGGGMAGAVVTAVLATLFMGGDLPSSMLTWPPLHTHPQPSITDHQGKRGSGGQSQNPQAGAPGNDGRPGGGGAGAAPPRPQLDEHNPPNPVPSPSSKPPSQPEPPGVMAVDTAKVELYGTKTARIHVSAQRGPVFWSSQSGSKQLTVVPAQGSLAKGGSTEVTITLQTALINLPGQSTLTFINAQGQRQDVTVTWGISLG
ncbi:RNA polymerase sigma factor [Actinomadura barringtoniae]|uniref:RNA polymerase sigma factor n=1 Tax=Actinomadura barringtoniae TaxID=1427535 RepID=A0A939PBD2_9ACTN|nr:RNA polymerase sigma factor [Actinomadura barringtoniae]MBO2449308.1 RNA polymerase sigma factor [Actinomadura barringtoniae]